MNQTEKRYNRDLACLSHESQKEEGLMKTKKSLWCTIAVVLLVISFAIPVSAQPKASSGSAPIKITLASYSPPGAHQQAVEGWAKELEQRSGGRIKVEIAWGAVMTKPEEHYDLAVNGLAEVALVAPSYTPGRFLMAEVVDLPLAKMTDTVLTKSYWELFQRGYFKQDYRDVKVLLLWTTGPCDYMTSKTPVSSFADMKGKKIRASGAVAVNVVRALGSIPVGMPAPEIYGALDKGTLDGVLTNWPLVKAYKTYEVSKYVTGISTTYMAFAMVMNQPFFAKLPEDIKAIVDDLSWKYSLVGAATQDQWNKDAQEMFKQKGGRMLEFSPADMDRVHEVMAPIWSKWIAEGEAKGLARKKMVDEFYSILKKNGVEKAYHGYKP